MICPKCLRSDFVIHSGETHYVCKKEVWNEETGCGSQFKHVHDDYIRFPYNVIFLHRGKHEFFRKPYLQLAPLELSLEL